MSFNLFSPLCKAIPMLIVLANCNACRQSSQGYYPPNDVKITHIEQTDGDRIQIQYKVKPETLFSSPGVDTRQMDGATHVYVARSHIERSRDVDVRGTTSPREPINVVLEVPANRDIFITDGQTERLIWRDGAMVADGDVGNAGNSDAGS